MTITMEVDVRNGKLVQRARKDAERINHLTQVAYNVTVEQARKYCLPDPKPTVFPSQSSDLENSIGGP